MADVSLTKLHKSFDRTEAVCGIDLEIADNEFVVLVGPSGCGKSTTLRMIAGLEEITKGDIRIGGELVNDVPPKDRDIAMVFQNYALYPHMTVFQNMSFGLRLRKYPKKEIQRRVEDAAEVLGISDLLQRRPKQLSGGQRQRVAMGRAIVRNPRVFLFDEPLSNLDAKLRQQMRIEIKRVHQHLNTTTVYVTHDQVEAMTLADRVVVMNNGLIEQVGTPGELYHQPRTRFVAGFIGSPLMNLISARLDAKGKHVNLSESVSVPLTTVEYSNNSNLPVTLGIRPEHLEACEPKNALMFLNVELLEKLGADTIVYGNINETETTLTVRLPGTHPVTSGDRLPLMITSEHLHIFHSDSGIRIN